MEKIEDRTLGLPTERDRHYLLMGNNAFTLMHWMVNPTAEDNLQGKKE